MREDAKGCHRELFPTEHWIIPHEHYSSQSRVFYTFRKFLYIPEPTRRLEPLGGTSVLIFSSCRSAGRLLLCCTIILIQAFMLLFNVRPTAILSRYLLLWWGLALWM